jgi:hypothetical protein
VNIISQIVQVFGFIRLGRMPKARNGAEAIPRKGTGTCICCQQPWHILARTPFIRASPSLATVAKTTVTASLYQLAETAATLFWALLASGQIVMRKVDGWQSLAEKPSDQI